MAEQLLTQPDFTLNAAAISASLRAAGGYVRAADEIFAYKDRLGIAG